MCVFRIDNYSRSPVCFAAYAGEFKANFKRTIPTNSNVHNNVHNLLNWREELMCFSGRELFALSGVLVAYAAKLKTILN